MSTSAPPNRSVVIERDLPHSPEKVWRALTQADLVAQWLMPNDFEPVVGRKFNFRLPAMPGWNGVTDCEVLAIEPHKHLSYTWGQSGDEAATGIKTVVTFTLTPTASGTRVRMEQSGFRPHEDRNFEGAKYGWASFIDKLESVLGSLED